jgi:hypothetical protein
MKPITPRRALDQASGFHPELEERLAEHFGERRPIRRIRRRLCPYTSSFHIDELDVRFRDGSVLKLVMKDLSRKGMLEAARRARPDFVYEPLREIKVYRSILPHAPPGTATAFWRTSAACSYRRSDRSPSGSRRRHGSPVSTGRSHPPGPSNSSSARISSFTMSGSIGTGWSGRSGLRASRTVGA